MRIAVDAMGGNYAPGRRVADARALAAVGDADRDFEIVLVGDESRPAALLSRDSRSDRLSVFLASEAIGIGESPFSALRRKGFLRSPWVSVCRSRVLPPYSFPRAIPAQ